MRIVAASTNETLTELNQCVHASAEFEKSGEFPVGGQLPVATVDAAACPESLGLNQTAFNALFLNKVAVWLHDVVSDVACEKDLYAPQKWYKRMVDAGALGIVTIVPYVGREAGVQFDRFDRKVIWEGSVLEDLSVDQYIPFLFCANDQTKDLGKPGSQASINAFVDSWYEKPESRVAPFNGSIVVDSLLSSPNPWPEVFHSTTYVVAFHVVVPLIFMAVFLTAMWFSYERFSGVYKRGHSLWTAMTPPLVALLVEGLSMFLLMIFYAVDGGWSNSDSPFIGLRRVLVGELLVASMSTSVLVGLTFGDFRRSSKSLAHLNKSNSFTQNHRMTLLVSSGGLLGLEVVVGLLRDFPTFYQLLNGIIILVGAVITVWFFYEAKRFTAILKGLASSSNNANTSGMGGSSEKFLRVMVRKIQKWAIAACISLFFYLFWGLIGTFHPYFIWRATSWGAFWFVAHTVRAFYALCKIQLCRLPRNQRNTVTMSTNPTQEAYPQMGTNGSMHRLSSLNKLTAHSTDGASFTGNFIGSFSAYTEEEDLGY